MSDLTRQDTPNATALNLAVLALMAIGIVMVFSTSASLDRPLLSNPASRRHGHGRSVLAALPMVATQP